MFFNRTGLEKERAYVKLVHLSRRTFSLPLEVAQHFSFHLKDRAKTRQRKSPKLGAARKKKRGETYLVDLFQREHVLSDDAPALITIGVVAVHFRRKHVAAEPKAVTGRSTGRRVPLLESVEEEESDGSDRRRQLRSVQRIGYEVGEGGARSGRSCRRGQIGA